MLKILPIFFGHQHTDGSGSCVQGLPAPFKCASDLTAEATAELA